MSPPVLVTIGPSHYCEKARWALDWARIPYEEQMHLPIFHRAATRPSGCSVPLLRGDRPLTDSSDILAFADAALDDDRALVPRDDEGRRAVLALEDRYDDVLGPLARRLAYCHLVEHPRAFKEAFRHGLTGAERALFPALVPLLVPLMGRAFRTSARAMGRCEEKLRALFAEESARLEGGRGYLWGCRFSAADLTFASLSSPVLLPPGAGYPSLSLDALPPRMRAFALELRATPAGAHALAMFERHRRSDRR